MQSTLREFIRLDMLCFLFSITLNLAALPAVYISIRLAVIKPYQLVFIWREDKKNKHTHTHVQVNNEKLFM